MWVFSFDRDETIAIGHAPGPVPLEWVRHLASETEHEIWAHGNQALKAEAGIPGWTELHRRTGTDWREHKGHVEQYDAYFRTSVHDPKPDRGRVRFLQILMEHYPDAERYVCVDDKDLGFLKAEGWEFFYPQDFVEVFVNAFEWPGT